MTTNDEWDTPEFRAGLEIGKDLGHYDATSEALRAQEMGELELWLGHCTPKTMKAWEAWEAEHGENFSDRWKTQTTKDNS